MKDIIILISALILTSQAQAWGPTGHRVVGEVAQSLIKGSTARKIKRILYGESLARVSTWADKIKSDPDKYKHTFNWHYTDWPDHQDHYDHVNNSGSLLKSIEENMKVLKDERAKLADRSFALKFIVHLVGDLHQPYHVGNGFDRGGNNCKVLFHGEKVNLHRLWDETMISFTRLSYTELAKLVSVRTKEERKRYAQGNILSWAKESKDLRQLAYPEDPMTGQTGQFSAELSYCKKNGPKTNEEIPNIGYEYSYKFMPIVETRLYQAGVRLAMLLDEAL